jgi:hypothetical protein
VVPHEVFAPRKKGRPSLRLSPAPLGVLALVCFAAIFWWAHVQHTDAKDKILAGSNTDMYMYHLPVRDFGFSRLKVGEIPLWNPYTNCGMPFLATYQAALYYPLNFPHWFADSARAISLIYLLHIFVAGAFMFLWVREIGGDNLSATFGGTAFMLCSFVVYILTWPHITLCHTWIPLVFLLIHRTFRRGRPTDAALLGVAVACQFLAGYLQGFVYTLYGAFAYVIYLAVLEIIRGKRESGAFGRSFALTLFGLTLLPALLIAFQLLPTYELSALSTRPTGGLTREAVLVGGSLYPSMFLAALTNPGSHKWEQYTLYPGIVTLALAVFALTKRGRWADTGFFLAMAVVSALIAFGGHTPLFDIYMLLPTSDWFRLPNRLLILAAFSVATLGAIGLKHLINDVLENSEGASRIFLAQCGVFIGLCAAFLLLVPRGAGVYVFILLVGVLIGARGRSASAVGLLAILLVALDLSLYVSNPVTYPWITPQVFPEMEKEKQFVREHAGLDRVHIFRRTHDWKNYLLNANFGMIEKIRTTTGYESLTLQRYAEFCAYLEEGGLPSRELPFTGALRWASDSAYPHMLNLLGARLIVEDPGRALYPEPAPPNTMPKGFRLKKVFSGQVNVYENPDAIPRAFFTTKFEVIKDKREVLARLSDKAFDYKSVLVLEEEPKLVAAETQPASAPVTVKPVGEDRIDLLVDAPSAGLVFLNDIFMPGWRARIGGKELPIYRADYLFMAVPVEAGRHSIEVVYVPGSFRAGGWISGVSIVALSFLVAFDIVRRRAKRMVPWDKAAAS